MSYFEQIKATLREKSGKKLIGFTVAVFLLTALIAFAAMLLIGGSIEMKLMDQYLREIPKIVDARTEELETRGRVYEDDALARGELGLKLFQAEDGLSDAEKLEKVRSAVFADSVSLTDGRGTVLATTGVVTPEERFRERLETLEARVPVLELYPIRSENGEETGKNDGKGFVMLPVAGNPKRNLVFEFSCEPMLDLYNTIGDWNSILERMLSGANAYAFVQTGSGSVTGYPMDGFTEAQKTQIYNTLSGVFRNEGRFLRVGNRNPCRFITLPNRSCFAVRMDYPEQDASILLAVPFKENLGNNLYSAVLISAIAGLGLVLFQIYAFRRTWKEALDAGDKDSFRKQARRLLWPGILIVVLVTGCVSAMTLLLEQRATVASIAITKREAVQHEIDWHKKQEDTIRESYADIYRTRAKVLADFLTAHPDYKTRADLRELSGLAQADYVMLFDKTGQELFSSNSFTGFSVGTNLSEEYRSVLMGYPSAVSEPAADPYTGQMQIGAAILMTDEEGLPDGFLLAVFSADALKTELENVNVENTVNSFAVQEGHIAALVDDEENRFLAHTEPEMIGLKAEDVLEKSALVSNFEGFAVYDGEGVYVSSHAFDGKSLMFIVPEKLDSEVKTISSLLILIMMLIQGLVFYPTASVLCVEAVKQAKEKQTLRLEEKTGSPMEVFANGYFIFFTLLAIVAWIVSSKGLWPPFLFVFRKQWSDGVHLFSLWAALFLLSVTLFVSLVIRIMLRMLERRLSLRAKTIIRLADSLISYLVGIFLTFNILSMFGVNTTALLASAGIISIAVGMGAQSMASDLLAGFFMMLEGSIHVGDHVVVSGIRGYVTDMGIRTTEITDEDGNVVILNNSHVSNVVNMTRKEEARDTENAASQ